MTFYNVTLYGQPVAPEDLPALLASPMGAQLCSMRDFMPGGIVNYLPRAADCKGCGAPLRAHICDYCKRTTQ